MFTSIYKGISALKLSELLGLDYQYQVKTWLMNNRGVCTLKSQMAGSVTTSKLVELGLFNKIV